jgi:hypothetical protein
VSTFCSPFCVSNELCLKAGLNLTNITRLVNNIPSEFAHCMFFFLTRRRSFPHARVPEWLTTQRHPCRLLRPIFTSPHPHAVLRTAPISNPHRQPMVKSPSTRALAVPHKQLTSAVTWNPRSPPRHPYLDYTSVMTRVKRNLIERFLLGVLERAMEGGL